MSPIATNLQGAYRARDAAIARRSTQFVSPVVLVAVSKTKPIHDIEAAFDAGQRVFGENYVQEACDKIHALSTLRSLGIEWHLIGPLQSNKAKLAALNFDWVQTVDRWKIADALSRHRVDANLPPLNVLVQVNASSEPQKSGVAPEAILELSEQIGQLPGLRLRGLMSIIENTPDEATLRAQFCLLRQHFDVLRRYQPAVDTLSMGMSGDFLIAIDEGATMVRVGSLIFGARQVLDPHNTPGTVSKNE
jgi:pyridoxal phosphate enzyme (YggS family)